MRDYEELASQTFNEINCTDGSYFKVKVIERVIRQAAKDAYEDAANAVESHLIYKWSVGVDHEPIQKILADVIRKKKDEVNK